MSRYLFALAAILSMLGQSQATLVLTSVFDGRSSSPKGVELYVGETGSYDGWTLDLQFNSSTGSFSNGYTFDSTVYSAGDFIYVTSTPSDSFLTDTGEIIISDGSFNMNGDDRIRLTDGTNVIDQFGVTGVDGSGEDWEYTDSVAYRNSETEASGSFQISDWSILAPNSLDSSNAPLSGLLASYIPPSVVAIPEPTAALFGSLIAGALGLTIARRPQSRD